MNKPVFELDINELKALGYDAFMEMKRIEKNLDLIEMELERRQNSVAIRMSQEEFNQTLRPNQK
jgi:hypothetical protein